jgi:CubicO group peptidase (beta-lactamase class C family)
MLRWSGVVGGMVSVMLVCGAAAQAPKTPVTGPAPTQAAQPSDAKQIPTVTVPHSSNGPESAAVAGPAVTSDKDHPVAHALEAADLEAFFDGVIPLQLERSDIAGASVLVMKDGQVLLEKGYGVADVKAKRPVDPQATIFRLASISKLFTWVSVMQLVEQGKLDLDTDVNRYLDFEIRPAFNQPITLRNLMTHTGGFEDIANDIILTDAKKAVSLRNFLIWNQPRRIFPPGEVPGYSNYGVGLASYIVQRASGMPFEQYVKQNIFDPLGMVHSSFDQPLAPALAKLPSEGYRDDTTKPPVGFEIFNPVGAGGISSSAADMGRFGASLLSSALLNGGPLGGKSILRPETLRLMWTPQFRASEQMPAICMGFYQVWRNGLRWIGHEGDLIAFHSLFFMEPTQKIVMFVSYNSAGGGGKPRPEIIDFFSDRYFPGAPKVEVLKNWPKEMRQIAGRYEVTRRAESTKAKLNNLFSQRSLTVDRDGVMHMDGYEDLRGHPQKWQPIGKDLWQEVGGQDRFFAIRDGSGKVVRLASDFPGVQGQRVPWYENGIAVVPLAGASVAILALVVLASLLRMGWRIFWRKRPRPEPQSGTIWLTFAPRMAAFVWIILLGSIGGFFAAVGDDLMPPTPDWFKWFQAINGVTALALLLSLFAVVAAIRIWRRGELRWITKMKFSLVGFACLMLSFVAVHWHLIGPAHRI